MLEEILDYIHNYFEYEIVRGVFSIFDGAIDGTRFIQDGQYFKIKGSVFNDGVHKYGGEILTDESFTGEVWLMAVPPRLIKLAHEIEAWCDANKDTIVSPYTSESFGGYSYTKATENTGNGGSGAATWRSVFGTQLNQWRKLA